MTFTEKIFIMGVFLRRRFLLFLLSLLVRVFFFLWWCGKNCRQNVALLIRRLFAFVARSGLQVDLLMVLKFHFWCRYSKAIYNDFYVIHWPLNVPRKSACEKKKKKCILMVMSIVTLTQFPLSDSKSYWTQFEAAVWNNSRP